jgi:P-type Cu+ transporter
MNTNSINIIELKVEGMTCTNCSLGIKKALEKKGLRDVYADFTTDEVRFQSDTPGNTELAVNTIRGLGYNVSIKKEDSRETVVEKKHLSPIEKKFWFSLLFTLPLVVAMFVPIEILHNDYFQLALTIPVFLVGFFHFGRSAYNSLRVGVTNMDVLIFMGSTAAFIYSLIGTIYRLGHDYMFYETSASIITLVLLGNMLEHRSVKRTTSAIDELSRLQKTVARRISSSPHGEGENIEEVDSTMVLKGDRLLVNTGDKIPVDGVIYWGSGSIDESMVSGESMPVERNEGDKVIGGTILESGNFKMKATATGKNTVLSQIIEMVRTAQQDKPQLQNLADRISAVFVPMVVLIALATFLGWHFMAGTDVGIALMRAIAVLVIACPCALGLAIPTAVVVGLGRTAKNGILIKGGSVFDKFPRVDKVVFDKTGTLTTGKFKVRDIKVMEGFTREEFQSMLYSLEKHSSHPLARSIVREFEGAGLILFDTVEEKKGMGMIAKDKEGNQYQAGSFESVNNLTTDNSHSVYLTFNERLAGWLDVEDEIKPEAGEAINFLKNRGIIPVLLSGDREKTCRKIAAELGIDEIYYEKKPQEKLLIIDRLSTTHKIAMVGDGINDAPALAKAFIGISMSNATQVAVKSAEVVLLKGNLNLLSKTFAMAQVTQRTIKENLFWAFFYNVLAIPLAIAGVLNPMVAAATMALSDVVVVFNSLRLKRRKLPLH